MLKIDKRVEQLIEQALEEDLNRQGDLTSHFIVSPEKQGEAKIVAKEAGIIAGLDVAEAVFKKLDANTEFHKLIQEGQVVGPGDTVAQIQGKLQALLAAERTALNFLQRLSG
ncbi:MAG: nicotinate-nucleotide diphosphorylase (carboxylating), partial [Calditrichaeota bacterium]